MAFLPVFKNEIDGTPDFVLVSGDAYVDHPSFATAVIGRWLTAYGYTVGIIPQPDFKSTKDFMRFGKPRYAFLISPGNLDSMVNIYTVSKHKRKQDLYSPGGKTGLRPKRASIVYTNKIREAYGDVPVIIGGIESSLRRFSHYDYWDDRVRQSILADSGADLLIYGMGEKPIVEVAEALAGGLEIQYITYVRGTCYKAKNLDSVYDYVETPSFEDVKRDKSKYCDAFCVQMDEREKPIVQKQQDVYVVQNPPAEPMTTRDMDMLYSLPFERRAHDMYKEHIPAIDEVKFSITSQRGCVGSCAFCAIYYHQGKHIQRRSEESMVAEAKSFLCDKDFKGYIHDVGGPTANFYGVTCNNPNGICSKRRCLTPSKCKFLRVSHKEYIHILRTLRNIKGIKKVFIRSGVRYDYALMDNDDFIKELAEFHVSGQLKLAPEHVSPRVLKIMGKPDIEVYNNFCRKFKNVSKRLNKEQYVLPYFMSSHPGCTLEDAIKLAEYIRDTGFMPKQVQDFYPTPGSLATCMYYTEMDPYSRKKLYVAKRPEEKAMQRALMQYKLPENRPLVRKALLKVGREDLIGNTKNALIR